MLSASRLILQRRYQNNDIISTFSGMVQLTVKRNLPSKVDSVPCVERGWYLIELKLKNCCLQRSLSHIVCHILCSKSYSTILKSGGKPKIIYTKMFQILSLYTVYEPAQNSVSIKTRICHEKVGANVSFSLAKFIMFGTKSQEVLPGAVCSCYGLRFAQPITAKSLTKYVIDVNKDAHGLRKYSSDCSKIDRS